MSRQLRRIIHSTWFSILVLLVMVAILCYIAYSVTNAYRQEPDFGGMVSIRQSDMKLDYDSEEGLQLSRSMILDYITKKEILEPIAKRCNWFIPYREMVECIDVKDRLASQTSYIIVANTRQAARSSRVARELSMSFLEHYRKIWVKRSKKQLLFCDKLIAKAQDDLSRLKKLRLKLQDKGELRPANSEMEMRAINEQLLEAQSQFLTAYGAFISSLENKRREVQLEYEFAQKVFTDQDPQLKQFKTKLDIMTEICNQNVNRFIRQRPDLYRLNEELPKWENLPNDLLYFYENIQTLQEIKLSLTIDSMIKEKENMLEQIHRKKSTIERLLSSGSCDVFIREVGR